MPAMRPSRIAIALLVFSLATFLWTFGLPQQQQQPVIDHYDHKKVHSHSAPMMPAPTQTRIADMTRPTQEAPTNPHLDKFCRNVLGAPHVMVVLRTSKAEMHEKLPALRNTLLSCVPHFAIFSDHAATVDGIPVHNALDSIDGEMKRTHDEFREYQMMHADPLHKPDPAKTKDLDKWKFLPMVYKAFHKRPSARFFVFIEMDTSLSWTNTLQWANRLDYRIPYYSGSPTFINGVQLAQRGSGIMLSQGAMRRYAKSYDELYRSKWEVDLGKGCCGDAALASALNDAHVEFYSSWPLMQGEQPASLDYSNKHWCAPAVSWHNANNDTFDRLWNTQKDWTAKNGWNKPFLYRDAFDTFVAPHIEAKKLKWDNLSSDTKIAAPQGRQKQIKEEEERSRKHKEEEEAKQDMERAKMNMSGSQLSRPPAPSVPRSKREEKKNEIDWDKLSDKYKDAGDSIERCQKTCEAVENCLQWRYITKGDGECHLGKVMRLGKQTTEKDDKWTSGWMVDRIGQVKKDWECKKVSWRFYQ